MASHEAPRFRITVAPSDVPELTAVAVPEMLGYVVPDDVPRWMDGTPVEVVAKPDSIVRLKLDSKLVAEQGTQAAIQAAAIEAAERAGVPKDADLAQQDVRNRLLAAAAGKFNHVAFYFEDTNLQPRRLPAELFIREFLEVDPSDPPSLPNFLREWGPLVLPPTIWEQRDFARLRPRQPLLSFAPRPASALDAELSLSSAGEHRDAVYQYLWESFEDFDGEERMAGVRNPHTGDLVTVGWWEYSYLSQFAILDLFQVVFRNWLDLLAGVDGEPGTLLDIDGPVPEQLLKPWQESNAPEPESMTDLLDTLIDLVNSVAAAAAPRIELTHPQLEAQNVAYGRPLPRILAAMCIQALRFIAIGAPASRCANESCGRFFTRQRGRSTYGQSRGSGVLYCSAGCARAQAQRAYRRRSSRSGGADRT